MRSRKNGEGSYSVVNIKGVDYQRYRYPNGKQIYAKTARELKAKKEKYEQSLGTAVPRSKDVTLNEVMISWLQSKYGNIEPTSYDNYESIIDMFFTSNKMANYQIASITPEIISLYYKELALSYSQSTISSVRYVFKSTIKYAIEKELIRDFNFHDIVLPQKRDYKIPKKKIRIVVPNDIDKIYYEALVKNKYGYKSKPMACKIIVFVMYSGLRIGEALALRWEDVEKDYSAIHICRTGARVKRRKDAGEVTKDTFKTHLISKRPKTDRSYRTIPLPQRARDLLAELSESSEHSDDDLVFSYKGHMLCYNSVDKTLKSIIVDAGCEHTDYTLHGLRHTYGSMLLKRGVDIKIVSELLGHSKVSFTYDVYIGILKEDKIKAVEVLD